MFSKFFAALFTLVGSMVLGWVSLYKGWGLEAQSWSWVICLGLAQFVLIGIGGIVKAELDD